MLAFRVADDADDADRDAAMLNTQKASIVLYYLVTLSVKCEHGPEAYKASLPAGENG
jgi:hypothetical protein